MSKLGSWDSNVAVCLRVPIPYHQFLLSPKDTVRRSCDKGRKTWEVASNLDLRVRKCFAEEMTSQ